MSETFLVAHLGLVDDELVLSVSAVDDFDALAVRDDGLPVEEEVDGRLRVLDLHVEDDLLPLDALLELAHPLHEAVVVWRCERAEATQYKLKGEMALRGGRKDYILGEGLAYDHRGLGLMICDAYEKGRNKFDF